MLDLKFIRANPELVKAASAKKHIPCDVDRILELDAEARGLGQQVDGLRARQKGVGKSLGQATAEERTLLATSVTAWLFGSSIPPTTRGVPLIWG